MLTTEQMLQQIAEACRGREKALDVVALDVSQLTVIADYFVIAAGRNVLQVKSIADRVEERLAEAGVKPCAVKATAKGYGWFWTMARYCSMSFARRNGSITTWKTCGATHEKCGARHHNYSLKKVWCQGPQLFAE